MKKSIIVLLSITCLITSFLFASCALFGSEPSEQKIGEISPDIDNIVGTWVGEITEVYLDGDSSASVYTCIAYTFYSDGKLDKKTIDLPENNLDVEPLSLFTETGTYKIFPGSEEIVMNIDHSSEVTFVYTIEQDGDEYYLMLDGKQYIKGEYPAFN